MANVLERNLAYRRAHWDKPRKTTTTVEAHLKAALSTLTTEDARSIERGSQIVRCVDSREHAGGGLWLHLTFETPGSKTSIIQQDKSEKVAKRSVATASAPAGSEFLDAAIFALVVDNNVVSVSINVKDQSLGTYIRKLLEKAGQSKEDFSVSLIPVADMDKVSVLKRDPAKRIEFKSTLFDAEYKYAQREAEPVGVISTVSKFFYNLVDEDDAEDDSLSVQIVLNLDGRRKGGLSLGKQIIENIAEDAVYNAEASDEFVIKTESGQTITPLDVVVRKKVDLQRYGNSVDQETTWDELLSFYGELRRNKVLE